VNERPAQARLAALDRLLGSMDSALVACQNALMQAFEAIRAEAGYQAEILVGVSTGDLDDYRPGQQAVRERGRRWPLVGGAADPSLGNRRRTQRSGLYFLNARPNRDTSKAATT
jgi:hypothetical protein